MLYQLSYCGVTGCKDNTFLFYAKAYFPIFSSAGVRACIVASPASPSFRPLRRNFHYSLLCYDKPNSNLRPRIELSTPVSEE